MGGDIETQELSRARPESRNHQLPVKTISQHIMIPLILEILLTLCPEWFQCQSNTMKGYIWGHSNPP